MKKSLHILFSLLILNTALISFSCSSKEAVPKVNEYSITVSPTLTMEVDEAYYCVSSICYLAGFEEYQLDSPFDHVCNAYLDKYKDDKAVKKAVAYYKKLRNTTVFEYDAPAQIAMCLSSDCHHWRADKKTIELNLKKAGRGHLIPFKNKILKVTADFYDATDFHDFYKGCSGYFDIYIAPYKDNIDIFNQALVSYRDFFHITDTNPAIIKIGIYNAYGNYGTGFIQNGRTILEPEYCIDTIAYGDPDVFVHEFCHTVVNPALEKLAEDKDVKSCLDLILDEKRWEILRSNAYTTIQNYLNELFVRASAICIEENLVSKDYLDSCYQNNIGQGFDEIYWAVSVMKEYQASGAESFASYADTIRQKYADLSKER